MRTFLKNNALAILVCLFAVGSFASATTITRPYGAGDYAGGTKAVGSYVNAEFANIVSWLNNGNITATNIGTGGVATANIASYAVTTAKIVDAAVTKVKLSAANLAVTSASSLYVLSNTTLAATITGLSTTITTSLRPVRVSLEANPGTYRSGTADLWPSYVNASGYNSNLGSTLFFVRDGSTTASFLVTSNSTLVDTPMHPCSGFSYTDFEPVALGGTFSYSVKAANNAAAGSTLQVVNCRLVVEEL